MNRSVHLNSRGVLFSIAFLSLSALVLSAWQAWSFYSSREQSQLLVEESALDFTNHLREITKHYFSGIFSSFYLVSRSSELLSANTISPLPSTDSTQLFAEFLHSNSNVYQIRYIDYLGNELLRVDRIDGNPQLAPVEKLQYKGDRDYFTQGMAAGVGELYISALDLNVENGFIEIPWRATIRAATPIDRNSDSIKDGLLVINIDAEKLLSYYAAQASKMNNFNIANNLMVLNDQGYWLYGVEPERLWGFMFDSTHSAASQYPQIWNTIENADNDSVLRIDQSVWVYAKNQVDTFLPSELQYQNPSQPTWHFLVRSANSSGSFNLIVNSLPVLILLALVLLSLGWSKSVVDRRTTEKALLSAEKLASLGGLMAGIAHELNTPIGSAVTITSCFSDLGKDLRKEIAASNLNKSSILAYIDSIDEGAELALRSLSSAAELISDFKEISVDQNSRTRREFELDKYIKHTASTVAHLFKNNNKTLSLELNSATKILSYPGPLSQVIINIIQNSLIHGFEPNERGTILISTSVIERNKVLISIRDNGKGIPREFINHIFEPFFTTKMGSGGSGLGLHLSHNIVTNILDGEITFTSDQEYRETTFNILIPIIVSNLTLRSDEFNVLPANG